MEEVSISFNNQELLALQQALHRALQQSGLEIVDAVNTIRQKLITAIGEANPAPQQSKQTNGMFVDH